MRWVGLFFVLLALAAAVADWMAAAGGQFRFRDVGEIWFVIHRDSLQLAQPAIERHIAPFLWDPVILTVLTWPAAPFLAAVGAVLLALGAWWRRRRITRIYPD